MSGARPEVAFVVQRYGEGIAGGSESLARAVAERLTSDYRITVFTSCARDYVSWRNELPAGLERLAGVDVRRFPVTHERDLEAFNAFAEPLYARAAAAWSSAGTDTGAGRRRGGREGPDDRPDDGKNVGAGMARITRADEHEFLRRQGPEAPGLVEALRAERDRFSAFVFFTYLYYPTYWGLAAVPERAALVPTTHDEPPLRFSIYREVFALPRAFGFLTPAEEALVRRRFDLGSREVVLAGMGVDLPAAPDVASFRARHGITRPYAIYAGRIDAGKGCAEMLAHHERYRGRQQHGQGQQRNAIDLLLIGRLAMPEPDQEGVRYLGFLPEAEKAAALAGAHAVVCPSPFESLSIALLEGLALRTPGLVNARSEVLKQHCLRSGASLFYQDGDEYAEALDLLARDASLRGALGDSGRHYVETEYRWDVVLDRWRALIRAAAGGRL
jgi:glycosyltransferase involved in cell wall biosynthesis